MSDSCELKSDRLLYLTGRLVDELATEEEFADIVVRQSPTGGIVRVRDLARVVDGFEDDEILATLNGEPAVLLQVLTSDEIWDLVAFVESLAR